MCPVYSTAVQASRNNTIFGLSAIFRDSLHARLAQAHNPCARTWTKDEPLQGVQVQECSPCCCEARGEVGTLRHGCSYEKMRCMRRLHLRRVGDSFVYTKTVDGPLWQWKLTTGSVMEIRQLPDPAWTRAYRTCCSVERIPCLVVYA